MDSAYKSCSFSALLVSILVLMDYLFGQGSLVCFELEDGLSFNPCFDGLPFWTGGTGCVALYGFEFQSLF